MVCISTSALDISIGPFCFSSERLGSGLNKSIHISVKHKRKPTKVEVEENRVVFLSGIEIRWAVLVGLKVVDLRNSDLVLAGEHHEGKDLVHESFFGGGWVLSHKILDGFLQ